MAEDEMLDDLENMLALEKSPRSKNTFFEGGDSDSDGWGEPKKSFNKKSA